jgi:glycosyltransferase involved in cell wall biosynthesis
MLENSVVDSNSKNEILVSVLIPVFGVENYIERCAHSLFSQTYNNIEYIFVDDCSKDKSMELLERVIKLYPQRSKMVKILKHQSNQGLGATRITAFNASSGDYIQIVDSDDYLELDMIELMIKEARKKSSDIIFCSFYKTFENGNEQECKHIYSKDKKSIINKSFSQSALWNKMFKRSLLTDNGISFYNNISYGEDLIMSPRLIYYATIFSFVDKPLYHYLIRNEGSYTFNFTEKHIVQTLFVVEELDSFFKNKPDSDLYLESINTLKAIRKAKILRSGFVELKYLNLYPELNNYIFKIDVDIKTKLILYFAKNKYTKLLNYFVSEKRIVN